MIPMLPETWQPRGIPDLEPNAWQALRQAGSTSVVAGPGAGKTEFLAQRAVYLLETGLCPRPYRILAISFKADAAENLAARVRQRCPPELSNRFVSMTFDAFTKSLVDRFHMAIPPIWRPTKPYDIVFPTRRQIEGFLDESRRAAPADWQSGIAALGPSTFEVQRVGGSRIAVNQSPPQSAIEFVVARWWTTQLRGGEKSKLTFVSLNRLAELLLRAGPHILAALRTTFPFVFVDEFQDTTHAQYDFLTSAFGGGHAAVTVVGDHKQRIMGWAGARVDAFEQFEVEFHATPHTLLFNFRSSPDLVRIQHVVAQALDVGAIETHSRALQQLDEEVVQVWNSRTRRGEGLYLARWLAEDMTRRGKRPRDYALLVRQKADEFEAELAPPFAAAGLGLRNESHALGRTTLQDLLADEISNVVLALLRLGARRRDAGAWNCASSAILLLRAADTDDELACHKVDIELTSFLVELRGAMAADGPNPESAAAVGLRAFAFLDEAAIARTYIQYGRNDFLAVIKEAFLLHLSQCAVGAADWSACLLAFDGVDKIPMMTVHKSKGLEYDTIAFVGLDDQSWWSHTAGNPEGIATFFVALSRAKQRAVFLFCQARGRRERVADLFQLLTAAGVREIET